MTAEACSTQVAVTGSEFLVDAALLGEILSIVPAAVPALMRAREISCFCERGVDEDRGKYRLNFSYLNRRARLSVDENGRVLKRSTINFGDGKPIPRPRAADQG